MDKTDERRMLRAMKYSCVVVSSNGRVLTASRCGGLGYLCCWLDDFACTCASEIFNGQVSVVHVPVYL
jgi:hypothetical protein